MFFYQVMILDNKVVNSANQLAGFYMMATLALNEYFQCNFVEFLSTK